MRASTVLPALVGLVSMSLAGLAAGCGSGTPDAATPAPSATGSSAGTGAVETSAPAPSATAGPDVAQAATAEPPAEAAPPKPGVPYDSVPTPGTNPLSTDEAKELKTKCKKLADAVAASAKKSGSSKRPLDAVFEALANPPKIAGVDVPRCADLMRRDTITYLAHSRESEAKINLRRVMVGLMTALDAEPPKLCGSAKAVPATVEEVKDTPYTSKPEDWASDGWKCARFDLSGAPQVFQYELRTNENAKSYEVIARGYPVQGGPSTELFIAGKIESGAIDPSTPILRR
ncbi:MAG: hypothetical protein R3B70_35480 [Polyangiaceae bacterium]